MRGGELMELKEREILDDFTCIERNIFIPKIHCWEEYGYLAKPFIRKGNIEAIRGLTKSFQDWGFRRDDESEERKKLLSFVFRKDFESKTPEEKLKLLRQACLKDKRLIEDRNRERKRELERWEGHPAPKVIKVKTREERLLGKYMTNTLSPSSYNYLKLKTKRNEGSIKFIQKDVRIESFEEREVIFEVKHLSDKSEMLIDFLFNKLSKRNDATLLREKPKENDIITYEKFETALEKPNSYLQYFTCLKFGSKEIRKDFGIRITDKDIQQAVSELMNTKIELKGIKLWYESDTKDRGEYYKKITHADRIIYSATINETGEIAPRTKDPQHEFTVIIGLGWSLIFRNDIINRRYACFPKEFYQARKGTRALGRYLSCWIEPSTLTIEQASEILGYGEETSNLSRRKYLIEQKLDELKEMGIIIRWKRGKKKGKEKKARETSWIIKK